MDEIYKTIPHRPPFLFIDRIIEVNDNSAIAERVVRAEEPHFEGHYPGNPIMPGVLLCEAVFQTAAVYIMKQKEASGEIGGRTPILARIKEAKFKQMVTPGDVIRIEATYTEALSSFHFMKGKVFLNDRVAMSIDFALALVESE